MTDADTPVAHPDAATQDVAQEEAVAAGPSEDQQAATQAIAFLDSVWSHDRAIAVETQLYQAVIDSLHALAKVVGV